MNKGDLVIIADEKEVYGIGYITHEPTDGFRGKMYHVNHIIFRKGKIELTNKSDTYWEFQLHDNITPLKNHDLIFDRYAI